MKKIAFLIILITGISSHVLAQTINDAGLWCTFNVEKKLTQKFGVFLTEEYRLKENFSRNNLFYTDLGLFYKPIDLIKVSLSYRCIEKFQLDRSISFRHRIMIDVLLKKKVEKFVLSFRQRLQTEYRNIYSSELGSIPEWYTRSKLTVKYDLDKPINPYVAVELRYQIYNPRSVEVNKLWHRARYIAGLDYKKNDMHTFGLYYLIQREWNVSSPQNLYIVGLEYSLSF